MKKNTRADFSQQTKNIIAARAAYRCSYPDCNATLIGPGVDSDSIENIGECAHIYSAAGKGPRCNHILSAADLQKPENGIFLCGKHHHLIDKGQGRKYPAETLMLYKQIHEHKVSEELGHITYPLLWIKRITVQSSPILKNGVSYDFTKSTIIAGTNGVGKSVLMEYIYTALTGEDVCRTDTPCVELCIEMSNPVWLTVTCIIEKGTVRYKVGEKVLTFCPFAIDVIYLRDSRGSIKGDMINWIGGQIGKDRLFVKAMIEGADISDSCIIKNARIETVRHKPYEKVRVLMQKIDDNDDNYHWTLEQFSGTETYSVVFDLVVGYLRQVARYRNALLLMDWTYVHTFCGDLMNYYFKLFHKSSNYFQTIAAMHTLWKDVDWAGWNLIKMTREDNIDIKWDLLA